MLSVLHIDVSLSNEYVNLPHNVVSFIYCNAYLLYYHVRLLYDTGSLHYVDVSVVLSGRGVRAAA